MAPKQAQALTGPLRGSPKSHVAGAWQGEAVTQGGHMSPASSASREAGWEVWKVSHLLYLKEPLRPQW